jgi:hypothetical protein
MTSAQVDGQLIVRLLVKAPAACTFNVSNGGGEGAASLASVMMGGAIDVSGRSADESMAASINDASMVTSGGRGRS